MTDLFWPGDERAGDRFGPRAFVTAMTAVEVAWLQALVSTGIAPADVGDESGLLAGIGTITDAEIESIAVASEAAGTPVIALVRLLRDRLAAARSTSAAPGSSSAADWIHRGLTSQDVVDTALVRCVRDVLDRLVTEFAAQIGALADLSDRHRDAPMAGRTLTQHAVPITFGLKAATWLQGLLDAADAVVTVRAGLRSQFGGAAGTLAATADLAARAGLSDPARRAEETVAVASHRLGLSPAPPWATTRGPITRIGDALVGCTDAWGRLATDVITLSRPEIAELAEPAGPGRGASSTMPQKRNPVLSALIRRAGLGAPMLGAQLHLAAADSGDERPAGAWQLEWATLRTLARRTVVAAGQSTELLTGLEVDTKRMLGTVTGAVPGILAERVAPGPEGLARPEGRLLDPGDYLGTTGRTIDAVLARAAKHPVLEGL